MKQIQLTQGKFALVDDEDYDFLIQWKWHAKKGGKTFYAGRASGTNKAIILMHRILMNAKKEEMVDHRDMNGLNCQKDNIRIATRSQNAANRISHGVSKYLGVSYDRSYNRGKGGMWVAQIGGNKNKKKIGRFKTEIEAALAYNKVAKEYHGEFARLNII